MEELTFWEFRSWMYRLHTKFPRIYTRKKQYELCWLVSGMPAEWFRERAKYVHMSNHGKFDWKKAVREKRHMAHEIGMARFLPLSVVAGDELKARTIRHLIIDDIGPYPPPQDAMKQVAAGLGVPADMPESDLNHTTYQQMLEREGVSSAAEILDKKKEVPSEA